MTLRNSVGRNVRLLPPLPPPLSPDASRGRFPRELFFRWLWLETGSIDNDAMDGGGAIHLLATTSTWLWGIRRASEFWTWYEHRLCIEFLLDLENWSERISARMSKSCLSNLDRLRSDSILLSLGWMEPWEMQLSKKKKKKDNSSCGWKRIGEKKVTASWIDFYWEEGERIMFLERCSYKVSGKNWLNVMFKRNVYFDWIE